MRFVGVEALVLGLIAAVTVEKPLMDAIKDPAMMAYALSDVTWKCGQV